MGDNLYKMLNDPSIYEEIKYHLPYLNKEKTVDKTDDLYELQLRKRALAEVRVKYFIDTFFTTEEIVQSIIDDIKRFEYDSELFEYYQEELHKYTNDNIKHIGTPKFKRYLDMVTADNTWMYVLMNPDQILMYPEYQDINRKYNIFTTYSAAHGWR